MAGECGLHGRGADPLVQNHLLQGGKTLHRDGRVKGQTIVFQRAVKCAGLVFAIAPLPPGHGAFFQRKMFVYRGAAIHCHNPAQAGAGGAAAHPQLFEQHAKAGVNVGGGANGGAGVFVGAALADEDRGPGAPNPFHLWFGDSLEAHGLQVLALAFHVKNVPQKGGFART